MDLAVHETSTNCFARHVLANRFDPFAVRVIFGHINWQIRWWNFSFRQTFIDIFPMERIYQLGIWLIRLRLIRLEKAATFIRVYFWRSFLAFIFTEYFHVIYHQNRHNSEVIFDLVLGILLFFSKLIGEL